MKHYTNYEIANNLHVVHHVKLFGTRHYLRCRLLLDLTLIHALLIPF